MARLRRDSFWSTVGHDPIRPVVVGLFLAVLAGTVGALLSLHGPVFYTSSTEMLIDDPYGLATSGGAEFANLDALRYKYAGLADTLPIVQPVATSLHLPLDTVLSSISVQVPAESLLMGVQASWNSAQGAQVLSQSIANEITSYVRAEAAQYHIPPSDQFTLNTVDPASAAIAHTPSQSNALTLGIGLAVLFFLIGLLGIQLIRFLR